jgi:hypothetical protein
LWTLHLTDFGIAAYRYLSVFDFSFGHCFVSVENRLMAPPLAKPPFVLLALCLWIFASSACLAHADDLDSLNQRILKLSAEGGYQESIALVKKAVEIVKPVRGPEHSERTDAIQPPALGF